MNSILGKISLVLITSFLASTSFAQSNKCITHNDLTEIAESFSQIQRFVGDKKQYCQKELGSDWLNIINSLVVLKNIQPNAPAVDESDAFTTKAITENNWWAYFTKRARLFTIERVCRDNIVAFVIISRNGRDDGNIHLCKPFFEETVSSQASTMMHEVRHFDDQGHVLCTRGNESGIDGACDNSISQKGSYAISVQTLVGLARSNETQEEEKPLLEAEALYMAFNKFNAVPSVALKNSILLSNNSGEVYKWRLEEDDAELMTTLNEPARISNSFNNITIYPLNTGIDAYRMDQKFQTKISNPGLFAVEYNKKEASERADYKNISYFGTGGLLKGNTLTTLCNNEDLAVDDLSRFGNIEKIISISDDNQDTERTSALLTSNGEVISFNCRSRESSAVTFRKENFNFTGDSLKAEDSFGLAGVQYAVLENGTFAELSLKGSSLISEKLNLPVANQNWISATPISRPEVF